MAGRQSIMGGRLALAGTIVYFLGYVFYTGILPSGTVPQAAIINVTHLGLIAFAASLHNTLRQTEDARPLVDLAFGSVVIAVVLEIVGWGLAAATAHVDTSGLRALLAGADVMRRLYIVPLGVFITATSLAMLLGRSFSRWVSWLGVVSGIMLIVFGFILSAFITDTLTWLGLIAFLGFAGWMTVTGVIMFWRVRPSQTRPATEAA